MAPALHSREELTRFLDGDPRLIWAAYRDPSEGPGLYFLEDDTAEGLREWVKAHLRCPLPECDRPNLVAVHRHHGRRDGFMHGKDGGNHAPESLNHLQGKAAVARWLTRLLGPEAVEVEAASDTPRSRVADVMATLPSGQRLAFEIQYAPLSISKWRERHESYRSQGIVDVWMWGHTRLSQSVSETFRLPQVLDEVRLIDEPVVLINPVEHTLAIAVGRDDDETVMPYEPHVELLIADLNTFGVDESGLTAPSLDELRAASLRRQARLDAEAARLRRQVEAMQRQNDAEAEFRRRHAAIDVEETRRLHEIQRRTVLEPEALEQRLAALAAQSEARDRQREADQAAVAGLGYPMLGPRTHCAVCGEALADVMQKHGVHVLCDPVRRAALHYPPLKFG